MQSVLFAIIGIFLYATQNAILDQKLRAYSMGPILLLFYASTTPLALALLLKMKWGGERIVWPSGAGIWYALTAGAVFFFADAFYVAAYTSAAGNVFAVTVCAALMPVFVALIGFVGGGTTPNAYQCAGIASAVLAVYLVAKGGSSP